MLESFESEGLQFALVALIFTLFWLALVGVGRLLARSPSIALNLAVGAVVAMAVPQLLSALGLMPYWSITLTALPFALFKVRELFTFQNLHPSKLEKISIGTLVFLFVCRFFEAGLVQPHGDPLYYHLLSAAKWKQLEEIQFIPNLPLLFQASWWDYIYLWPAFFFQTGPHKGLVASQIFSQWSHLFIAFLGSLLLWYKILRDQNVDRLISLISTLAIAACASLWWSATLAKNDWGSIFLFLGGLCLALENKFLLAGLLFGFSFAAKWTAGPVIAPLFLWLAVRERKNMRQVALLSLGFILGVAPIAIRNFVATANPIFPVPFGSAGRPYLSETFLNYIAHYTYNSGDTGLAKLTVRSQLLFESPFVILGLGAFVFLFKRTNGVLKNLYLVMWIGYLVFSVMTGSYLENRIFGPGMIVMVGLGVYWISEISRSPYLLPPMLLLAIVFSRIPTHMPLKFFSEWPLSNQIKNINAGELKTQMWQKIPAGQKIVTTGDNENFYLAYYDVADIPNSPRLDQIARTSNTTLEALRQIKQLGYRYVFHTPRYDGHCWEGFCERLQKELEQFEKLIVLRNGPAAVLDLDRLETLR